ncbi:MAG: hypothetical protein J6Q74_04635 [Clostridia bacterium]|nr:hypothetical protein [Clostridia bacterium]
MKREKLTVENIKADLRKELKNGYIRLISTTLIFVALVALIIRIGTEKYIEASLVISQVFFCFAAALLLYVVIIQAIQVIRLHKIFYNTDYIVTDKLVGMEIEEHYNRVTMGVDVIYHLHFSSYGKYTIPLENYKWSEMFSMSNKGVYNYSECDDEFYLVLSKPHTGKILLAYNTKLFEMK